MRARAAVLVLLSALLLLPPASAAGPRTADSDNSFEAATEVSAAGYRSGSLSTADDPSDFYRFSATSGMIIRAFIFIVDWQEAAPGAVDFSLILYDRARSQVAASTSDFQYETVSALAVAGGTYYLQLRAESGGGSYTLDWSVSPAQTLRDGDEIHGVLSDSGNRNADWYRVQLKGGKTADTFKATMHEDEGALFDLYFMDLWSEYSLWYDISWWSDPDEQVEATATYGGWYYLWVSAYQGSGNYTLDVAVTPGTADGDSEAAGARSVAWNSSFYDSVDMAYDHYDWYRFDLAADETLRAVMRLDPAPTDMFALSILGADLSTLEDGMKTNYVDGTPPGLDRTVTLEKTVAAAGTYYVVVMARVGLKDTIVDLSDRNARSDYLLSLNFSAHAPGPENHAPLALGGTFPASLDANTTLTLDLGTMFEDPDGDTLRYAASGNGSVRVEFPGGTRAVLRPDEYFVGRVNFTLNATDPGGLSAAVMVDAEVLKVPFPPVIFDRSPAADALTGANGTTVEFSVSARDPNHQVLSYAWSVDGAAAGGNANVLSWKVPAPSGSFTIECTVENADGNASTSWTLNATAKPPLKVTVVTPLNNSVFAEGEKVTFYAVVAGLLPEEAAGMTFTWSLDGRTLGTGAQFTTGSLPPGDGKVTVTVTNSTDPAETGQTAVSVFVEEGEAPPDYTLAMLAAGALLALAAVAGAALYRRGARQSELEREEEEEEAIRRRRRRKPGKRERAERRAGR